MVNKRSTDLASYANLQGEFNAGFLCTTLENRDSAITAKSKLFFFHVAKHEISRFLDGKKRTGRFQGQSSSALEASTVLTKRLNLAAHMSTVHINSRRINRKRRRRNAQPCSIARIYWINRSNGSLVMSPTNFTSPFPTFSFSSIIDARVKALVSFRVRYSFKRRKNTRRCRKWQFKKKIQCPFETLFRSFQSILCNCVVR